MYIILQIAQIIFNLKNLRMVKTFSKVNLQNPLILFKNIIFILKVT